MLLTKTPTSSLSGNRMICSSSLYLTMNTTAAFALFLKQVRYRTPAAIRRMWSGGTSPEAYPSPVTKLPLEVVQIIVAHLIYDTRSLLACSLTCSSWYIAAVPHLHHTLTAPTWCKYVDAKHIWPKPLQNAHKLGLLPLVQKFQVYRRDPKNFLEFSPERFNHRTLRQFLALTNVQELVIDCLDIPGFMPNIQLHFSHFFPTLRSLTMGEPKGSRRQVIYFIGLFQHLEDLEILYDKAGPEERPEDDLTLVPSFVPPLRGRLAMHSTSVDLLKDMIGLFRGIRSCYLDISNVDGTPLLLDACAETLETLRLHPSDSHGEGYSLSNAQVL